MQKVRISHFTAKNIPISKENCANVPVHDSNVVPSAVQSFKSKKQREILVASVEAKYASVPHRPYSELVQGEIRKAAAVFRGISNLNKKSKKKIRPFVKEDVESKARIR